MLAPTSCWYVTSESKKHGGCQSLTNKGCIRKARQLTCCLAALWGNDFAGSVFARRHLMKLISDGLLRQRNGLMIYNKIERVLVITKQIFNYYNTNFSLEITSKVQKNIHLNTNWPPNTTFRRHLYFLAQPSRNGTHRIVGYQRQRRIHAAFKIRSEEGTTGDRKWSRIWIWTCLAAFLPFEAFGRSQRQTLIITPVAFYSLLVTNSRQAS